MTPHTVIVMNLTVLLLTEMRRLYGFRQEEVPDICTDKPARYAGKYSAR